VTASAVTRARPRRVLIAGASAYAAEEVTRRLVESYTRWLKGALAGRTVDLERLRPFARDQQAGVMAEILNTVAGPQASPGQIDASWGRVIESVRSVGGDVCTR